MKRSRYKFELSYPARENGKGPLFLVRIVNGKVISAK